MIKKIIQICSMLILVAVFTVISAASAGAQTGSRIEARIPFKFNIGEKSYDAGDYVIKTLRLSDSTVQVSLADSDGKGLHNFLAYSNGEMADGDQRLVFAVHDNRYYLSKILTNDKGLLLSNSESKKLEIDSGL